MVLFVCLVFVFVFVFLVFGFWGVLGVFFLGGQGVLWRGTEGGRLLLLFIVIFCSFYYCKIEKNDIHANNR